MEKVKSNEFENPEEMNRYSHAIGAIEVNADKLSTAVDIDDIRKYKEGIDLYYADLFRSYFKLNDRERKFLSENMVMFEEGSDEKIFIVTSKE